MNKSLEQLLADGVLTPEQAEVQSELSKSILTFVVDNDGEVLHVPGVGEVTVSVFPRTGGLPNNVIDDGADLDYLLTVNAPDGGGPDFTLSDTLEGPSVNQFYDPDNLLDYDQRPVATVVDRDSVAALTQFVVTQ